MSDTTGRLFLGVDTSNYTTSLALCGGGKLIKSVRRLLPVKDGECGLRQSDAVFLHTKALPELANELFSDPAYRPERLAAVGVSEKPRDAEGSYMPCFLAGISFAAAVSDAMRLPLFTFSHQAGHLMAGIATADHPEHTDLSPHKPFLAFHVSGGTTEALLVTPNVTSFSCKIVGGTTDASAGQIIDRCGVMLGLPFPCGKALDALSLTSDDRTKPKSSVSSTFFSLSGLQNQFEALHKGGASAEAVARFVFLSIAENLLRCTENLRKEYGELPVLYVGGVMSNTLIRERLSPLPGVSFASAGFSTDNAFGTALLSEKQYIRQGGAL